jgi:(2Fe-2S) ferredoxin
MRNGLWILLAGTYRKIAASSFAGSDHAPPNFMPKFERHIFVCGNQRPPENPRGSCDPTAQGKLQKSFKQKLAERGLKGKVRANQSGCLDQCEHGPTVVVYPEAVWYGFVTEVDVAEIVESHIVGGKPVKRLVLADGCLNTATCEHRKP